MKISTIVQNGMTNTILYNTTIVSFDSKRIILNSGGFLTNTTKRAINQISENFDLKISVYQNKKQWYVSYNGKEINFYDGIEIIR